MTEQQPITPPPALLKQLREEAPRYRDFGVAREEWIATQASRWGWEQRGAVNESKLQKARDEELEACCEWLAQETPEPYINALRAARRPNPKSLVEEALEALNEAVTDQENTIRRALKRLQELEGQQ